MQKKFYKGLYGTDSIEFAKGLINIHPFGEIGRRNDGQVKPHAHNNLFQIFLVEAGATELQFGQQRIPVEGPAFLAVPKNVEHGFSHRSHVSGWIITLADTVLEHMLQREAEVVYAMDEIYLIPVKEEDAAATEAYALMQKCVAEYRAQNPGRLLMLQYLVGQMLVQLYRISLRDHQAVASADNVSKVYYRRFQQLLKAGSSYKKSVEQYAKDLNISTGHLTRVCRSVSGKSPKDIIIDYVITEAQLALSDIEKSVSDISFGLGFDDPAYFTRLFRKRTGLTPMAFRKQIGVKKPLSP
ncbi:AraC family transcriptional regulator [Rufibacter glacialis]|uniref:AraC family transcriptional regulator n=1 Tax=Rufibacter glacialis TaxID=1259555 RepID=A0A5M8QK71_9BACT|nr:AraC family transcriptional regulator [Rufibacter glacialis]KAA6435390.1 helix-turn-helix domain-containing protein [Rufibacter glacialis]GGK63009.1 transcriptional regulator [Rufibacter glacialis]